jgi:hypothetical protein
MNDNEALSQSGFKPKSERKHYWVNKHLPQDPSKGSETTKP